MSGFSNGVLIPNVGASGQPTTGNHGKNELWVDTVGDLWICTVSGTPGTWINASLGTSSVSTVFARSGAVVAVAGDYTAAQVTNAADTSAAGSQTFTGPIRTPRIGLNAAAPSVAGTRATAPPTNATIQTALGNLALGVAYQNTLSYDVRMTIFLSVTVNTSGVVALGVGTTSTPTQTNIVSGVTTVGFVPITFTIPAGYFALLSISGTVTDSIAGQYLEAA